jgi:glycosyltransferase involved in cell wall biosynthesis
MAYYSVCITVYNGEKYIARALESVRSQTFTDYELIVLDDGSSDESAAIAAAHGARVIRQENSGVGVARQRLLTEATGEWLAFLDHDDRWEPNYLQRMSEFSKDPKDVFRYTWIHHESPEGEMWDPAIPPRIGEHAYGHVLPQRIWPSASVFRRELLLELGGFQPELKAAEDWLVFFNLASRGRFAYLEDRLVYIMRRPGSTSSPTRSYYNFERSVIEDYVLPKLDTLYPDFTPAERALYLRETKKKLGLIKSLFATWQDYECGHAEAMATHRAAVRLAPTLKGVWYRYLRSALRIPFKLPGMTK